MLGTVMLWKRWSVRRWFRDLIIYCQRQIWAKPLELLFYDMRNNWLILFLWIMLFQLLRNWHHDSGIFSEDLNISMYFFQRKINAFNKQERNLSFFHWNWMQLNEYHIVEFRIRDFLEKKRIHKNKNSNDFRNHFWCKRFFCTKIENICLLENATLNVDSFSYKNRQK